MMAISAIVLCCVSLASGDALIKWFSISFSLWQLFVVRSCLVILALALVTGLFMPRVSVIPKSFHWVILRSLLLAGMWVSFYAALPHIQLSLAAAVVYTTPLLITLLSAMLGGDRVTGRVWLAITAGFLGVLLIVRPGVDEFNGYELLPLLAAIFYALAMVFTRMHMRDENAAVLALWLNIVFAVLGAVVSISIIWLFEAPGKDFFSGPWHSIGPQEILIMAALAAFFLMGNLLAAYAYQNAPAPLVATFDYSYLVFSTTLGMLVFGERPDLFAFLGMTLIALAGISAIRSASREYSAPPNASLGQAAPSSRRSPGI